MSVTTPSPVQAPQTPKAPKATGWVAATIVAASLALVGMLAAVFMAFAGPGASIDNAHGAAAVVTHHKHSAVIPTPVSPAHPVTPSITPSSAIKLEQQQLARLNYYEGPINGYDTQATINAITYLQRDAGLPQTGHMNSATQAALIKMLINGNNNMAG